MSTSAAFSVAAAKEGRFLSSSAWILAGVLTVFPVTGVLSMKALVPLLVLAGATLLVALIGARVMGRRRGTVTDGDVSSSRPVDWPLYLVGGGVLVWGAISAAWAFEPAGSLSLAVRLAGLFLAGALVLEWARHLSPDGERSGTICGAAVLLPRLFMIGYGLGLGLLLEELLSNQALFRLLDGLSFEAHLDMDRLNRGVDVLALGWWPFLLLLWQRRYSRQKAGEEAAGPWILTLTLGLMALFLLTKNNSVQPALFLGLIASLLAWWWPVLVRWAMVAFLGFCFLGTPILARLLVQNGILTEYWIPYTARHRVHIWDFVLTRGLEKPWFGWGLDASRDMPNFEAASYLGDGGTVIPLHPHNAYLQIWLELGGGGVLLAFAGGWILIGRVARLSARARSCCFGLLAVALVLLASRYGVWQTQWLATLFLAAAGMVVVVGREATSTK